jgi:gliding motility-associated-like protein
MKSKFLFFPILVLLIFFSSESEAQLQVTTTNVANQLAQKLVGPGVTVSGAFLNCPDTASGTFMQGVTTNLGINKGIVLTTGFASDANANGVFQPLCPGGYLFGTCLGYGYTSIDNLAGSDADLDAISSPQTTYNACALEFDVFPLGDTLSFNYVFASEEYTEYTCSNFNDIFAFFLSGINPGGGNYVKKNIALIPNTTLPVAINTVNGGSGTGGNSSSSCTSVAYSSLFVKNTSNKISYDGFTKVLKAWALVKPCTSYHLKLAISDVGDEALDSGVFLEEGSLTSSGVAQVKGTSVQGGFANTVEGCVNGVISLKISKALSTATTIKFTIGGTAVNGVDYSTIADSLIIPAGDTIGNINITPIQDFTSESTETIKLYLYGKCATQPYDSAVINIVDSVVILSSPSVSICLGDTAHLSVTGATNVVWTPADSLSNPNIVNPVAHPSVTTTYHVTSTIGTCTASAQTTVTVGSAVGGPDQNIPCFSTGVATMAAGGTGTWTPLGTNPGTSLITTPTSPATTIKNFSVAGTYNYIWTKSSGCKDTVSLIVGNSCGCANPPTVAISPKTAAICAYQTQVVSGTFGGSATLVTYSSSGTGTFSVPSASASPFSVTYTPSAADKTTGLVRLFTTTNNPLGSPCNVAVDTFILTINPSPVATAGNTGPYCTGSTISLSSGGGSTYAWSGPSAYSNGTQNPTLTSATTAMSGVYTVTVTSASSCTATATTTAVVNSNPTASASNSGPYCPGTTISLTGGAAGNSYSWSGPNSFSGATQNPSISGATAAMGGTYTITVTSAANCTATASTNVVINTSPSVSASNTGPYCEGATISLGGGANGLVSYAWSGPNAYNNGTQSPTIANSTPAMGGVYTITVTDASLCTATASTTVEVNPLPQISASAKNTICTANNGMVVVSVNAGGTPGYNYTWSPPNVNNDTISGLGVNIYNVTVTDSKNCSASATANVVLTINPVPITLDRIVNVKCNGLSTGAIDVTVGSGALAYTYQWNPTAQNTEDATGLSAGPYTLIATDQFGCIDSAHYTVTEPTALNFSVASHTDNLCYGGRAGTATLTVFGGSGSYHFLWNDPSAQTSATATGLAAGTYTATVTDDSACVATTSVTIAEPTAITFASPTIASPLCFRSADGSITSSASGGTGTIAYSWSHNAGLNNTLASPLDTGLYFQVATDGNGCSDTAYFHIQDPTPIQFNAATVVDVNCNRAKDGSISSTAQGGTGALTYSWNFNPTLNLTNLVGLDTGTYIHYATDVNGCKDSAIYIIHEPTAVLFQAATIVNTSCHGGNDGSITSVALGGTGAITYSWSHDLTLNSSTATGLTAGTYTQTATDASGCSITNTFTVTEPTAITFGIPQLVMVTCNGGNDATITSSASGGTGLITYSWSHDGTLNSSIASNLTTGTYSQTATDVNGCTVSTSFTITEPAPIVFINQTIQDVKCHGENTGSIHSEATGGTGNIQYGWSHNLGLNSTDALNLIQGTYYQIATDANGCKDTSSLFVVNEPTQLTLLATATPELCIGASNGTVTATAGGGTPGYSYDLTLGGSILQTNNSGSFTSLSPATYIVDVTDANGCTEMQTAIVTSQEHDMFTVDVDSTSCYGSQYKDGAIRVESQTLLNGPYQYSIDSGKTYSYVSDFYNLKAGVYTVHAKNNNGCDTSFVVEVPEPLPATLAIIPNDTTIHIGQQIGLTIQLYPYPTSSITSYHWTPAAGLSCDDCPNPTMTSYQKNNTYLLEVTYSNECKTSAIATINIQSDTSLYIPNAFSPNGDGNNDLFGVYGRELKTVQMEVFNRWGEKVYDSMDNPFASWDGRYKGELQPPSVYVYSVEVEYLNAKKVRRSGSVTLIR